jgi:hypothetical protein
MRGRPGVKFIPGPRPLKHSAMYNNAAYRADGEVRRLLNNDTEVISPDWIEPREDLLLPHGHL